MSDPRPRLIERLHRVWHLDDDATILDYAITGAIGVVGGMAVLVAAVFIVMGPLVVAIGDGSERSALWVVLAAVWCLGCVGAIVGALMYFEK